MPELLVWDRHYKTEPHDHLLLSWTLELRPLADLAREWHALDHRLLELETCALALVLNDEAMRSFSDETRDKWAERLSAVDDQHGAGVLRHLIARFDPANYRVEHQPEVGSYWAFVEPEELRAENEAARRESAEALAFLGLGTRCRMILDGQAELKHDELEEFWRLLCDHERATQPADMEEGIVSREDGRALRRCRSARH